MTDLFHVMRRRRSIRKYTDQVPQIEVLRDLVEYAALAPNAMNRQDWRFTIIFSPKIRDDIFQAVAKKWADLSRNPACIGEAITAYAGYLGDFRNAPVLIAVDVRRSPQFMRHLFNDNADKVGGSFASACMAVENLLLAAEVKGLGACVYSGCNAAEKEISGILNMSRQRELVCLVAVGYPAEKPVSPGRKAVDTIIRIVE